MPSRRFLLALLVASVPLSAAGEVRFALWLGLALDALLLCALAYDFAAARACRAITAERQLPPRLYVGEENTVVLRIHNPAPLATQATVVDDYPAEFRAEPEEFRLVLGARELREERYRLVAPSRGDFLFGDIYLRWSGPLGLCLLQKRIAAEERARVYPRFLDFSQFDIEAQRKLQLAAGPEKVRLPLGGTEFESLREYVPGDDTRRIDWKATARRGKLIVRNYEEERSKDIVILLDCGRMMAPEAGGLSKLDHAINASLMLCSAGVSKGDRVGVVVFSDRVKAFLPPQRGKGQVGRMMDVLYGVQVDLVEPDYAAAFGFFKNRLRKRCLAVLFTDLIDTNASSALLRHVAMLYPAHLPLCVTIKDISVERAAQAELQTVADVYRRAVAEQVITDRALALAHLRAAGVVVLDALPEELSVRTVNKYLELKSAGRI